jgi:hypothetical protein
MPRVADAVPVMITRRIPAPVADVNTILAENPAALLGELDPAAREGPDGRLLVPLEARFAGVRFDRTAAVGFGPAIEEDDGSRWLPLWWEAADQPWLFPTFVGGLEVRPSDGGAVLRLEGRYSPPLGAAGGLINRAVLNRAATASLETLLDRLSIGLADNLSRRSVPDGSGAGRAGRLQFGQRVAGGQGYTPSTHHRPSDFRPCGPSMHRPGSNG